MRRGWLYENSKITDGEPVSFNKTNYNLAFFFTLPIPILNPRARSIWPLL